MKVLHTADWHAGKTLARQSRTEETRQVLNEIVEIARTEEVDVLLVAGDVFDQKAPSAEAEAVVYDTLLALERENIHVVLLAGNHDHPQKWKALRPLLGRFHINVAPEPALPEQGGVVEIKSPRTSEILQVVALPWVPLRKMVNAEALMNPNASPHARYSEGLAEIMKFLASDLKDDACSILAAHLSIDGALPGGGERALTLGSTYAFEASNLPQVQYVALGHVHRPQTIPNSPAPTRYSGSPMQLDFGEVSYQTSVTLLDIEPYRPVRLTERLLTSGRRLMDVRGSLEELEAQKDSFGDAFLRVTVRCAGPTPGIGDRVREIFENALEVRLDYHRKKEIGDKPVMRTLSARDQYSRYLLEIHGKEPDAEDLQLFQELLEKVEGGEG